MICVTQPACSLLFLAETPATGKSLAVEGKLQSSARSLPWVSEAVLVTRCFPVLSLGLAYRVLFSSTCLPAAEPASVPCALAPKLEGFVLCPDSGFALRAVLGQEGLGPLPSLLQHWQPAQGLLPLPPAQAQEGGRWALLGVPCARSTTGLYWLPSGAGHTASVARGPLLSSSLNVLGGLSQQRLGAGSGCARHWGAWELLEAELWPGTNCPPLWGSIWAIPKARPHPDGPKQGHRTHLPAAAASP